MKMKPLKSGKKPLKFRVMPLVQLIKLKPTAFAINADMDEMAWMWERRCARESCVCPFQILPGSRTNQSAAQTTTGTFGPAWFWDFSSPEG